jgi:hypothetical protein
VQQEIMHLVRKDQLLDMHALLSQIPCGRDPPNLH